MIVNCKLFIFNNLYIYNSVAYIQSVNLWFAWSFQCGYWLLHGYWVHLWLRHLFHFRPQFILTVLLNITPFLIADLHSTCSFFSHMLTYYSCHLQFWNVCAKLFFVTVIVFPQWQPALENRLKCCIHCCNYQNSVSFLGKAGGITNEITMEKS